MYTQVSVNCCYSVKLFNISSNENDCGRRFLRGDLKNKRDFYSPLALKNKLDFFKFSFLYMNMFRLRVISGKCLIILLLF